MHICTRLGARVTQNHVLDALAHSSLSGTQHNAGAPSTSERHNQQLQSNFYNVDNLIKLLQRGQSYLNQRW